MSGEASAVRVEANPTPRVVLGDDEAHTRAGIRMTLEADGFEITAEASTGPETVEAVLRERPDLCLLAVGLPGGGVAAAAEIGAVSPGTAVVMLTAETDEDSLFAALRAGARGYLLKGMDPERLAPALHGVLAGEAAIPRVLVGRMAAEFPRTRRRRESTRLAELGVQLSRREWDVLELMRAGLPTAEIADRLSISPITVRRHISTVVQKLGVQSREAALELLGVQD